MQGKTRLIAGFIIYIFDALRDLVQFVQFKKREKHPQVTLLQGCFSRFFKLCKWYQIAQSVSCNSFSNMNFNLKQDDPAKIDLLSYQYAIRQRYT